MLKEKAVRRIAREEGLQVSEDALNALDDHIREVLVEAIRDAQRLYLRVHGVHVHKAVRKP